MRKDLTPAPEVRKIAGRFFEECSMAQKEKGYYFVPSPRPIPQQAHLNAPSASARNGEENDADDSHMSKIVVGWSEFATGAKKKR